MPDSISLAEYLFTRLRQLGVGAVHGIGSLITTFGVGELSAINAIAGSYAEFAPVVHIVGTPSRASQDARLLIHHTFADGEYGRFAQMSAHITVAQTSLWDPHTCAQQIDTVLQECVLHCRPVYIQVPVDLVSASLPSDRLRRPIGTPVDELDSNPTREAILAKIVDRIHKAKKAVIIADGECRPLRIIDEVQAIIDATKWPTWTTPFGKGLFNETGANFHGIYKGKYNEEMVQETIKQADLVLFFGPHLSSTNTYGHTAIPSSQTTIFIKKNQVDMGTETFRDVSATFIASRLLKSIDLSKITRNEPYPRLPRDWSEPIDDLVGDQRPICQDKLWRTLANILRPGDIVLGETGTAGFGVREMPPPPNTRVFTPVTWLSIGFMLPAAQGAAMAQRELMAASDYHGIKSGDARTILLIGDGSFQMTAQEMATIIHHKLDVLVFLINNDGYTIERCIHGRNQGYNHISPWRYLDAPRFFGAGEDTYTATARTWTELAEVLKHEKLKSSGGLKMVEIFVDREDAPKGPLLHYLETQKSKEATS
ncbi:hypothetical protein Daus18300_009885 [Diaporthe australafricana]|uniref:Pyruvate decarboxylase n=1 Tax=Diaporthe australafricana TaxID=127596 RepID=A0ABR3WD35_9PEZI